MPLDRLFFTRLRILSINGKITSVSLCWIRALYAAYVADSFLHAIGFSSAFRRVRLVMEASRVCAFIRWRCESLGAVIKKYRINWVSFAY